MKRRKFLASGALVAGTVTLSGCTDHVLEQAESQPPVFAGYDEEERDLPVTRRFDRAVAGIQQAEGAPIADHEEFRTFLDEQDAPVESLEETVEGGERLLELEYTDDTSEDRGLLIGLGVVSGGYAALVANEDEPADRLQASVHESIGETFGEYEVETTWAEEFLDGELSAAKYAGEVLHTLETSV